MMQPEASEHSGGCLCGAVRYGAKGALRPVVACHCRMCQKTSGYHVAATSTRDSDMTIDDPNGKLTWFASSDFAKRAFCASCGSNLFYKRLDSDRTSIFAGTLDQPTGLKMVAQIFTEDAGDYYTPSPDVPILSPEAFQNLRMTDWEA
ncbi:MAG: GFA family protein [Alphaproteobacteria bacterium]